MASMTSEYWNTPGGRKQLGLGPLPDPNAPAPPKPTGGAVLPQYGGTAPGPQQTNINDFSSAIRSGQGLGGGAYTPGGTAGLTQGAYEQQQQTSLEADLQNKAFQARLTALGGGGGAPGRVSYDPGGGAAAAQANAFAKAKDQAGMNALAALHSLQGQMESSGRMGSSTEQNRMAGIMGGARGGVQDIIDQQLQNELARTGHIADTTYQGNITQRAQDMQALQGLQQLYFTSGRLY